MPEKNVVNYAHSYQQAVAETFYKENLFSDLLWQSPNNPFVEFLGAKHIKVPKIVIDEGRRDRQRRTLSTPTENYSNDWDSYELKFDRYWETLIDPLDVDETNLALAIPNVTRAFNVQQKMPEMDRYMFSRLYAEAKLKNDDGVHEEKLTEANILEAFDQAMSDLDEARVPSENRILYVTTRTYVMLKNAEAKNRALVITGSGDVSRSIYSLDEVMVVKVPTDLMRTAYDFEVGSKVEDGAGQIEMLLIYNGAQIAPQKYSFVGMDAPSAATSGNYHYYEQDYLDVFLLNNYAKGIAMYVSGGASAGGADPKE